MEIGVGLDYTLNLSFEEQADLARTYLRTNVQFGLTEDGRAGLKRFFAAAADVGVVPQAAGLRFFDA